LGENLPMPNMREEQKCAKKMCILHLLPDPAPAVSPSTGTATLD
jgi:hypothetical protein